AKRGGNGSAARRVGALPSCDDRGTRSPSFGVDTVGVMRFAVNLPNFGTFSNPRFMVDLGRIAEEAGWDGFFVWDHIVVGDGMPVADPWVLLGAVAGETERILIGTMVTPVPRRRPWVLARQATTIDHLSDGRLVLGVGIGFPPDIEFGTFD